MDGTEVELNEQEECSDVNLTVAWIQGKCLSEPWFLSNNELFLRKGSFMKVVSLDKHKEVAFQEPPEGLQCVTCDPDLGLIAVASGSSNISVLSYPALEVVSVWITNKLGVLKQLQFAGDKYLLTLEASDSFTLTVWGWQNGQFLASITGIEVLDESRCRVSVNPECYKILAMQDIERLHLFEIEDTCEQVRMRKRTVYAPLAGDAVGNTFLDDSEVADLTFFEKLNHEPWGIHSELLHGMPLGVLCAGVKNREIVQLFDRLNGANRTEIFCHCWTVEQRLVFACTDGTVAQLTVTPLDVKVVHRPTDRDDVSRSRVSSLAFNRDGLWYCTPAGDVYVVKSVDDWSSVLVCQLLECPRRMLFSPSCKRLAFYNENGSVQVLEAGEQEAFYVSSCTDDSEIVGTFATSDSASCVVARSSGFLEMWERDCGAPVVNFEMRENVVCVEGVPSCSVLILSSATSQLRFLEFANPINFRVVKTVKLSEKPVYLIKPDPSCRFAVLATSDKFIFLCSILPSQGFKVLGYFPFEEDIRDIVMFREGLDKSVYVFLLGCNGNRENSLVTMFELPADFVDNAEAFWQDESGVMKRELLRLQTLEFKSYCCSVAAHSSLGLMLCFPATNDILRISPEHFSSLELDSLVKCCRITEKGGNFRLILSPNQKLVLVVSDEGAVSVRCSHTFKILSQFELKIPKNTLPCASFNGNTVLVGGSQCELVCLKVANSSSELDLRWKELFEQNRENENKILIEMKTDEQQVSESWMQEKIMFANKDVISEIQNKKEQLVERLQGIEYKLLHLMKDNLSVPEEYRIKSEKFILDEEVREVMLRSREEEIKEFKQSLKEKLKQEEEKVSNIQYECIDSMIVAGKKVKSLKQGRLLQNFSIPTMSVHEKEQIQYSHKKLFLENCMKKKDDEKDEVYIALKFEGRFSEENVKTLSRKFQKQPFLLQSIEERVDYIHLLKYLIFIERMQFNQKFDDLLAFRKDTIKEIKTTNKRLREIFRLFGEDTNLWEPIDDDNHLQFTVTEEEIEEASKELEIKTDKPRGLAENVLKEEWLLKRKALSSSKYQPKLKKEQSEKMKKESEKKLKEIDQLVEKYQKQHESLVDEKLQIDLDLNQIELQIFTLLFSVANFRNFKRWESIVKQRISDLEKEAEGYDEPVQVLETRITESKAEIDKVRKDILDIDGEVQRISKVSGNKQAFLEAYDLRPKTETGFGTLNPYRRTETVLVPMEDLNATKNKPPKVSLALWKQLCSYRERKHHLENQVKKKSHEMLENKTRRKTLKNTKESTLTAVSELTQRLQELHETRLRCGYETPMVLTVGQPQLEMEYPDHLDFRRALLLRRFHAEGLNALVSNVGRKALESVKSVARARYQIERNEAMVRINKLKTRDAKKEIEVIKSISLTKDVQKIVQDPRGFRLEDKLEAFERSKRTEEKEYRRQVEAARRRIEEVEVKKEKLRRSTREKRREIEKLKGDIAELRRIERLRRQLK